jgi:hypothetical protein
MATAQATPTKLSLVKTKVEGTKLLSPLEAEVKGLIIRNHAELTHADQLLYDIGQAIKQWDGKMEPILKPLREAKTAADALKREIAKPLQALYDAVRVKIRDYRIADNKRIEDERREKDKAQALINKQLEEASARELAARTKQLRERLAAKRVELEAQAEELEADVPEPVKTEHSTSRTVKKWRVVDRDAVLRGVVAGKVPQEAVIYDTAWVNKRPLTEVATWPGFEIYDDLIIAGR